MSLFSQHPSMKPGTPLLRPTWWLSLGLAVGLLLSLARSAGLFNTWRLRSTDFLHGDTLLGEEIVIVTIDDASLGQLGSWPWTHSTHARLIETLAEARVISVDVLFETTEPDDPLVEATARAGNVIYPILAVLPERAEPGLIPAEALIEPASLLQGSAAGLGIANILPDGDGVVRRVPLAVQENDHRLEALSLQVLRRYLDLPAEPPGELDAGLFVAGLLEIPVDPWGRMTIHFASEPGTFPTVSYSDVLSGAVPPVTFQDKIVLVGQMGLTGGGDHHVVPTSHGGHPMAGVEVQANIIHAMLKQRYLREQSLSNDVLIIIGLALLSSLILPQIRWPWAVLCTLLLGAGCLLLSFVAFDRGLVLDLLYPTASLALSHVTVVTGRLVIEERRRRRVADLFGRYVSPEIMGEILSQQETAPLELGGEQREITVLFVDIRGYSAFSERLSPHRVVEVLNRHLARMTRVVFEHGGTVDKFTGDGLMALFGAPLAQQDHAVRAVQAALALQAAVQQANDGTLQYGIGIHTGEAVVGNIGSQRRLEYTAIGDTVNLAFRLEEQAAPGQILISQATFERAQGLIRAREIGPSPVKGRREAVVLYEVLAMLED